MIREDFPSFLQGKKTKIKDNSFRKLTTFPMKTKRTAKALKCFGITDEEVKEFPELLNYNLLSLPRDAQVAAILQVPLLYVSSNDFIEKNTFHLSYISIPISSISAAAILTFKLIQVTDFKMPITSTLIVRMSRNLASSP